MRVLACVRLRACVRACARVLVSCACIVCVLLLVHYLCSAVCSLLRFFDQKFGYWDRDIDFFVTSNFFATSTLLVRRGNRFLFTSKYIFIAQVHEHYDNQVNLIITRDGGASFHNADLPFQMMQHSCVVVALVVVVLLLCCCCRRLRPPPGPRPYVCRSPRTVADATVALACVVIFVVGPTSAALVLLLSKASAGAAGRWGQR